MAEPGEIAIRLELDVGDDAEETAEATSRLQQRLNQLEAARTERVAGGPPPEGAYSGDLVEIGQLLVHLTEGAAAMTTLIGAVRGWLSVRRQPGSVKLTVDGDSLEVTGDLSPTQQRAIDVWLNRHEPAR